MLPLPKPLNDQSLQRMMEDDRYWNESHPDFQFYRGTVEAGYKKLYPRDKNDDQKQIGPSWTMPEVQTPALSGYVKERPKTPGQRYLKPTQGPRHRAPSPIPHWTEKSLAKDIFTWISSMMPDQEKLIEPSFTTDDGTRG